MSIIERSNPLNLQYRVCLVTAASTPLGVIVCKTLLKANAFVLGIDARPVDHSLNAGLGTHFQFEQCDLDDAGTAARIVAAAKDKFGLERLDALISLVNAGQGLAGIEQLSGSVGEVMRDDRRGLIVNVLTPGASDNTAVLSCTKRLVSEYLKDGVRCNAILPKVDGGVERDTRRKFEDAKTHMAGIIKSKRNIQGNAAGNALPEHAYEIANLILWLAGDQGEAVAGKVLFLDGSSSPL